MLASCKLCLNKEYFWIGEMFAEIRGNVNSFKKQKLNGKAIGLSMEWEVSNDFAVRYWEYKKLHSSQTTILYIFKIAELEVKQNTTKSMGQSQNSGSFEI